jgi:hypothetical protein
LIELHSIPVSQAGLQDIELAMTQSAGIRRFHNRPTVEELSVIKVWLMTLRGSPLVLQAA